MGLWAADRLEMCACRLAAAHYCNREYEKSAHYFGRMAAFQALWRGTGHPACVKTIDKLSSLFEEDQTNLKLSFHQVLRRVEVRSNP